METTKTFVFPENNSGSNVDPNMLLAMMNGNNGFGNNSWIWVIFLFFLYGWRGNGLFSGGEGLSNTVNNDYGRSMLLEAINGNRNAISNLATQMNCSEGQIQNAINNVQNAVCNVGNQVGMTGQQVINAIQQGNMNLASQLSQCCCDSKILAMQNQNQTMQRIDSLSNVVQTGFSTSLYESAKQTCNIENGIKNQTQTIMDKLSSMEANAQQDKINSLTAQLTAATSRAERAAELAPIYEQLNQIRAAQPSTATVTYPNLIGVPLNYYLAHYGLNTASTTPTTT